MGYRLDKGEIAQMTEGLALAERIHAALLDAAGKESDCKRAKRMLERKLAEIVARTEGKSHAEREAKAKLTAPYQDAEERYLQAFSAWNTAKAEADALQVRWETWRSMESTKREEMRL